VFSGVKMSIYSQDTYLTEVLEDGAWMDQLITPRDHIVIIVLYYTHDMHTTTPYPQPTHPL
jgi:hypothetical protein